MKASSREINPSVIQLYRELNLTRIIRSIARRSNFAKAGVGEVTRSRYRGNAVSTKVGSIEVRVVQDVEELRPELQPESLGDLEIPEHREIHTLEWWPSDLVRRTSQDRNGAWQSRTRRWLAPRTGTTGRARVTEEAQLSIRVDVKSAPGIPNKYVIAAAPGRCS